MAGAVRGEPPCRRLGIVGVGLVGSSIALGLRRAQPDVAIVGVDTADVRARACARGVIDEGRERAADLTDCDLVVLSAPVPAIGEAIRELAAARHPGLVTDVGSTKRRIVAEAAARRLVRFVGGHPMAGAERGGLDQGRADLFRGRTWLVIPQEASGDTDVETVERLARELGAIPRRTDAETHDRVLAYVSHLPQMLAVALMNTALEACGPAALEFSGPAFREMTRLAGSPAALWAGILVDNGDYLVEAVRSLAARLPADTGDLAGPGLSDAFHRAAGGRAALAADPSPKEPA